MHEPVLASRILAVGAYHNRVPLVFVVHGGLHYIRGNGSPYFSLTCWCHRKGFPNQCQSGGCAHDLILRYYPQFADLAALHLCDMDGAPMHTDSNGWYDLAGFLPDHANEQYHVGNSERHFPKPDGATRRGEWDNTDYRKPTREECLQIFADHVRVDLPTARALAEKVIETAREWHPTFGSSQYNWPHGRAYFAKWIDEQRPRWKAEAEACIAKHSLRIYGDEWVAQSA